MTPTRTKCKVEGCSAAPHVTPGGWKIPYCRAHMKRRHAKQRDGQPSMTGPMQDALSYLRDKQMSDEPFAELRYPLAHGTVISSLLERDWILESEGPDGVRYRITGRGLKALKLYETPRQRRDGICPACGVRPKRTYSTGRRCGWCLTCDRAYSRKKTKRLRQQSGLCCRCHKRPRRRLLTRSQCVQ